MCWPYLARAEGKVINSTINYFWYGSGRRRRRLAREYTHMSCPEAKAGNDGLVCGEMFSSKVSPYRIANIDSRVVSLRKHYDKLRFWDGFCPGKRVNIRVLSDVYSVHTESTVQGFRKLEEVGGGLACWVLLLANGFRSAIYQRSRME